MTDLLSPAPLTNATEYSVSEISGALKRVVEDRFGHVRVRGEISGYRGPHSSGHAYFTLKDDRARLDAVVWKTAMAKMRFRPEEGMEVIATGKLTTYPGKSNYQIVIDQLEPAGAGALMALLEERKKRLAAEGLFETDRKRPLPFMPRVIGVVTSPTGAVIRDILHRIADRFPLHVVVWPVRVQGETSGPEVCSAIQGFNTLADTGMIPRPDVLIVARGGGSLEDLWGFNDEACARAVFKSDIPLIAAIGHETDWTLIDLVADRRAPTPTGAAEMAVPVKAELEARLASLGARLRGAVTRGLDRRAQAARSLARARPSADAILAMPRRHFDEVTTRLHRGLDQNTHRKRVRLDSMRITPAMLTRRTALLNREVDRAAQRLPAAVLRRVDRASASLPMPDRLARAVGRLLNDQRAKLTRQQGRIRTDGLAQRLARADEVLRAVDLRKQRALGALVTRARSTVTAQERMLTSLSYRAVLKRGFVVIHDADDRPVTAAATLTTGQALSLEFADGRVGAQVTDGEVGDKTAPAARPKPKRAVSAQPNLFDL